MEEPGDRQAHLPGRLEALAGVEAQRAVHQRSELGRDPGRGLLERLGRLGADQDQELAEQIGVPVRRVPAERLVEHHAEGPDVGALIEITVPARLLRRHVERRAEHAPRAREPRRLGGVHRRIGFDLGDAEVEQLDDALAVAGLREEEVRRLDVAVDDALVVRALQADAGLRRDAEREVGRERAEALDQLMEILALEVLHHQEGQAPLLVAPRAVDADDVRRVDRRRRLGLAREAAHQRLARRGLRGDDLDGDARAALRVDRFINRAHPAGPKEAHDLITSTDDRVFREPSHARREYRAWVGPGDEIRRRALIQPTPRCNSPGDGPER